MKIAVVIDGCVARGADAHVPISDRGFLFGDGVSETILGRGDKTFARERHIERLARSCDALRIAPPTAAEIARSIDCALASESFDFAAVRVMVTRGDAGLSLDRYDPLEKSRLIVIAREIDAPRKYVAPIAVARTSTPFSSLRGAKGIAYAASIAEKIIAHERGFDDAIYVDLNGHVIEGATSNVLAVVGGVLVAPIDDALLGVTRRYVLARTGRENFPLKSRVEVRALSYDELLSASEIFLTSSLRGIAPIHRVEDRAFDAPGPVTKYMQDAYFGTVTRALGAF